jgi:hypothetical protein
MQDKSKWATDATKGMTIATDFREPGIWAGSRTYRKDFGVDDVCLKVNGQSSWVCKIRDIKLAKGLNNLV